MLTHKLDNFDSLKPERRAETAATLCNAFDALLNVGWRPHLGCVFDAMNRKGTVLFRRWKRRLVDRALLEFLAVGAWGLEQFHWSAALTTSPPAQCNPS